MIKQLLKRGYRLIPGVRELIQMRDLLHGFHSESITELNLIRCELTRLRTFDAIRLVDFELREHPRYGDPRRLLRYQFQVCSASGDDGIIQEIFRRVGTIDRTFAEVGVGDGKENNTAFLLSQGWRGFWIDGNPSFLETIEKARGVCDGHLTSLVSMVTRENAAALFERLRVPKEFDFLSLDIDQNTYYLWEGLRDYRPRVVVVEYNACIPPDVDWKVNYLPDRVWDGTQNFGASLKAYENLGRQLGYSLVGCEFRGVNAYFVRDDLVEDRFAAPFTSENHYEPARYAARARRGHSEQILDRAWPAGGGPGNPGCRRDRCGIE
jgi:hypothetical protein